MTRYTVARERRTTEQLKQTHVIWRGIGCILMLIVPIMAWALASISVRIGVNRGWPLPYQLLGVPVMPRALWQVPALWPVLGAIEGTPNLYAILAFTIIYIIAGAAILSFLYALVYRIIGPPRYGPLDAPPPKVAVGRYKR
jgi:hypothetical protein